ncbi:MAG: hypothetical protein H5U40_06075, partial [Polyangiaceae bacterium]|nr:hypothetical protein [Polyangiaceae bacterium]
EAVQAASLLAENATHLAEAANAAAFDRRLVIDAYDFAEQAVYFERLVASGADPRTVERDFHSLARDYERLHSNFGRYGFERQGRHLEDDFNEVRQAFYYTAETLRTAYAYSSPGRGYYARGRGAGRYDLRFQLNF